MAEKRQVSSNHSTHHALDEASVAAYLLANPDFFMRYPDVAARIKVPHHGYDHLSLVAYQVRALQLQIQAQKQTIKDVHDQAKQNDKMLQQFTDLSLDLLEAEDLKTYWQHIEAAMTKHFKVDVKSVWLPKSLVKTLPLEGVLEAPFLHQADDAEVDRLVETYCPDDMPACPKLCQDLLENVIPESAQQYVNSMAILPFKWQDKNALIVFASHELDRLSPDSGTFFLDYLVAIMNATLRHLPTE